MLHWTSAMVLSLLTGTEEKQCQSTPRDASLAMDARRTRAGALNPGAQGDLDPGDIAVAARPGRLPEHQCKAEGTASGEPRAAETGTQTGAGRPEVLGLQLTRCRVGFSLSHPRLVSASQGQAVVKNLPRAMGVTSSVCMSTPGVLLEGPVVSCLL